MRLYRTFVNFCQSQESLLALLCQGIILNRKKTFNKATLSLNIYCADEIYL